MLFHDIHKALFLSSNVGEIQQIVRAELDAEEVLNAKTRKYAENWLLYSPKDATPSRDGELPTFSCKINEKVQQYCCDFIIANYDGKLPKGFNALTYLQQFENRGDYSTESEFSASSEIFEFLNNFKYADLALQTIFDQNWC
jgi:hypothetical protein